MTYTAENPHADGIASPGACPCYRPPRHIDLHDQFSTHDNWMLDRRPVVSKLPLHRIVAAKMSPHISISPEPVLADHVPPPGTQVFARSLTWSRFLSLFPPEKLSRKELRVRNCSEGIRKTQILGCKLTPHKPWSLGCNFKKHDLSGVNSHPKNHGFWGVHCTLSTMVSGVAIATPEDRERVVYWYSIQ